jgi:FkbM family methyltransferase
MGNFISRHRRHPLIAGMAKRCQRFLNRWHNLSYDCELNGEHFVLERLAASGLLRSAPVFDVGANIGQWTEVVKTLEPAAQIHAFEIVPDTFAKLQARVGGVGGIELNNQGLGARAGTIVVHHFPKKPGLSSTVPGSGGGRRDFVEIECPIIRGDDYMQQHAIPRLSFLKIDVEGGEPDVLAGFEAALSEQRIAVIQFEYGKINISRRFLLADFYALFARHGYAVGKIYPNYVDFRDYHIDDEDFRGPNYLALAPGAQYAMNLLR